ncbi:MAG: hypothetical protein J6J42_05095 [Lachnospiraceae bacterium]|nr:hypothetical protein [Lachnospiraceae bacterium]
MMIPIRMIQGLMTLLLFRTILLCIRKWDDNHGLPQKTSVKAMLPSFIVGFCLGKGESTVLLVLYVAYLAAMAYSDYHSKYVYSVFYILVSIPGYVWLFQAGDWSSIRAVLIFCLMAIVFSEVFKAFKDGDMEVFIASAPYITLLAQRMDEEAMLVLVLFLVLSLFFSIVGTAVLSIRCRKFIRKNVMVPYIYGSLFCVVLLDNLF